MQDTQITGGVETVAQLMAIAAITAPKTAGQDYVRTRILSGDVLQQIGEAMVAFGEKTHKVNFDRDGANVQRSDAILLIGLEEPENVGLDCGACGFEDCAAFLEHAPIDVEFKGPICAYRLLDMGIAIGSAVKTASIMNVDNRVMYRLGVVARDMGLVDWDFVMGIPLSVSAKSIYYDR